MKYERPMVAFVSTGVSGGMSRYACIVCQLLDAFGSGRNQVCACNVFQLGEPLTAHVDYHTV